MKGISLIVLGCVAVAAVGLMGFAGDGYPQVVTDKRLYAGVDLRGKAMPKYEPTVWLNGANPETKGKVVVYDLWATWCGPCRKLIPEMNEWHEKLGDDVVFIGISNEKPEVVQEFMKTTKMSYSVGIDGDKKLWEMTKVEGIPHVLVVSPDGIVRWQGFPGDTKDPLTLEKLQAIVAASKG